jgi:hypothetical protein
VVGAASLAPSRRSSARSAVDLQAEEDFAAHHGHPDLGPVAVVVAAYMEADNIAQVVGAVPDQACGLALRTLVVVDGGDDGTVEAARRAGAYACWCPENRGQGAALRLGYRLAAEHGARILVTIDADGQYYPRDIPAVLEPVVAGQADLVSGSRRLGSDGTPDPVRRAGVVLFSWLISALCRHRVTDPANGLRAMRAEVPASLELSEDQYQASELLVGALRRGWRVAERPVSVAARLSGSSKKAGNLLYGLSFLRVVVKTWLRGR